MCDSKKCLDFYFFDDLSYYKDIKVYRKEVLRLVEAISAKKETFTENVIDIVNDLYQMLKPLYTKNEFDMVVSLGGGGQIFGKILKEINPDMNIRNMTISRKWTGIEDDFVHEMISSDLYNKNIVLIDDVVVSGSTFRKARELLCEKYNCNIIGCYAGVANEGFLEGNYKDNYVAARIISGRIKNSNLNSFWYPAIYSFRHLVNQENGMKDFARTFVSTYFGCDEDIEDLINQISGSKKI